MSKVGILAGSRQPAAGSLQLKAGSQKLVACNSTFNDDMNTQ